MEGFALPNVEAQLQLWMLAMIRPGAAFLAAPVFGGSNVPVQLRLVLALAVGIPAAAASGMAVPHAGIISVSGFLLIIAEVIAGLAIGFALQIGFAAAVLAGEAISNAMGIAFAAVADPANGTMSPAIGQYLSMLATFLLLATDGHLALIAIIVDSYTALPPGNAWLSAKALLGIAHFGSLLFAAGLSIALPVGCALIMVQIMMGMVARSAPTLNLFAVGLPATLLAGVVLLAIATPVMADTIMATMRHTLDNAEALTGR
jgi:flagellar biosynthesis protein FliR